VRFIEASTYTPGRPWGALDLAEIDDATVRLHWTEHVERLTPGRICYAEPGDEHVAHAAPETRILVIERKGSI
jgi:hypothetical protein